MAAQAIGVIDEDNTFHGVTIIEGVEDAYDAIEVIASKFDSVGEFLAHIQQFDNSSEFNTFDEFMKSDRSFAPSTRDVEGYWILSDFPYAREFLQEKMDEDIEIYDDLESYIPIYLDEIGAGPTDKNLKFILEGYTDLSDRKQH